MGGTEEWWVFGCARIKGEGLAGTEGALLPSPDRTGWCPCGGSDWSKQRRQQYFVYAQPARPCGTQMGPMWAAHVGPTWILSRGPIWDPGGAAQVGPRWVPCGPHMGPTWGISGLLCGVGVGPIWAGPDRDDVGYIWGRYGPHMGTMWARCGYDVDHMWGRCGLHSVVATAKTRIRVLRPQGPGGNPRKADRRWNTIVNKN